MRNFQDTFETRKRSFINAFSICMTVPLWKISILAKLFKMLDRAVVLLAASPFFIYLFILQNLFFAETLKYIKMHIFGKGESISLNPALANVLL